MIVNGEKLDISVLPSYDIPGLLKHFSLHKDRVAVEINGNIIKKSDYNNTNINKSDNIEIIHFVGGGS